MHAKEQDMIDRMRAFLERCRGDREPTRVALTAADAIHQHLEDLLSDDPGDRDRETLLLVLEAERHVEALCRVLRELVQR
jgi:hypothetical protein